MVHYICFFSGLALQIAGGSEEDLVRVTHLKPSRLISQLNLPKAVDVRLVPNDSGGTVRIMGSAEHVATARSLIWMMDQPRQSVRIRVEVKSSIERSNYEVTARLLHNQIWKTGDEETGLTLAIKPFLAPDGNVTISLRMEHRGGSEEARFRVRPGETLNLQTGSQSEIRSLLIPRFGQLNLAQSLAGPTVAITVLRNEQGRPGQ